MNIIEQGNVLIKKTSNHITNIIHKVCKKIPKDSKIQIKAQPTAFD